jgi:hypothetical protein
METGGGASDRCGSSADQPNAGPARSAEVRRHDCCHDDMGSDKMAVELLRLAHHVVSGDTLG